MESPKIEHMALFIGWSKTTSKKIAETLCDYIAKVNPYIVPFVSSVNIAPGKIWRDRLSGILRESHYGILCMTKENLQAPWLHYEAGVLSMATSLNNPDGEPRVAPLLFGVESTSLSNPLSYYQSAPLTKNKFLDLMREANEICIKLYGKELHTLGSNARMEQAFLFPDELKNRVDEYYPKLEEEINKILAFGGSNSGGGDDASESGNSSNGTLESGNDDYGTHAPDNAVDGLRDELENIYQQFGMYPDIARIYFEGCQLIDLLRDKKANQKDKEADLQRFLDILKDTAHDLDRPEGSTEQRKARSQAIKELKKALENLLV